MNREENVMFERHRSAAFDNSLTQSTGIISKSVLGLYKQWRFYVGARGAQAPQILPSPLPPPQIFGHSSSATG